METCEFAILTLARIEANTMEAIHEDISVHLFRVLEFKNYICGKSD